jgi:RecB family exonuclease
VKVDLRNQPPVPENVEAPGTVSATLMGHLNACRRSAYLYMRYRGGTQGHPLARGDAAHEVFERATKMMLESSEPHMPGDVVRDLATQVIADRVDLDLPVHEMDAIAAMAWNWGEATYLDLENIAAVETLMAVQVGGWTVRGRIDRGEIDGSTAYIDDYKTALSAPSQEAFEKQVQLPIYALLFAEGQVVSPEGEVLEPEPMGKGLANFRVREVYPRIPKEDGTLFYRETWFDQAQIHDIRVRLEALLGRLEHGLQTAEWKATPGTHCKRCPAPSECPLPPNLRTFDDLDDQLHHQEVITIETLEEASEYAQMEARVKALGGALHKSLKGFAEENDVSIPLGEDLELAFTTRESDRMRDKEELKRAMDEAGLKWEDHFKPATTRNFGKRKIKADEG